MTIDTCYDKIMVILRNMHEIRPDNELKYFFPDLNSKSTRFR